MSETDEGVWLRKSFVPGHTHIMRRGKKEGGDRGGGGEGGAAPLGDAADDRALA